jgi:hypothetical protein
VEIAVVGAAAGVDIRTIEAAGMAAGGIKIAKRSSLGFHVNAVVSLCWVSMFVDKRIFQDREAFCGEFLDRAIHQTFSVWLRCNYGIPIGSHHD